MRGFRKSAEDVMSLAFLNPAPIGNLQPISAKAVSRFRHKDNLIKRECDHVRATRS